MSQGLFNEGYEEGLKDAALIAERVRDAKTQLGKHEQAEGAEKVRERIQHLIDA